MFVKFCFIFQEETGQANIMQQAFSNWKYKYWYKQFLIICLFGFSTYVWLNMDKVRNYFQLVVPYRDNGADYKLGQNENYSVCQNVSVTMVINEYKFDKLPTMNLYIYSAYLDLRTNERLIKVIGMSDFVLKNHHKLYCQIYYKNGTMVSVSRVIQKARIQTSFLYVQSLYVCEEPLGINPVAVSLSGKICLDTPSTRRKVNIRYNKRDDEVPNKYLLCLNTIFRFKHPKKLIAFIEYQRMLGLTRIIVYDFYLPSEEVMKVIKYYIRDGILTVQPWKLPVKSDGTKWPNGKRILKYYGQHMQINDCMYRNMNDYKYILSSDLDEYVVFQNPNIQTYQTLMEAVEKKQLKSASYRFESAFLCLSKEDVKKDADLVFLFKTYRANYNFGLTKSIYNPRKVLRMTVHQPVEYLGITKQVHIPNDQAVIHHYRRHNIKDCYLTTNKTLKLASKLQNKVNQVFNEIFKKP